MTRKFFTYTTASIVGIIKLKSVRWDVPFSTFERDENLIKFLVGNPVKLRPFTLNPIQNYGNNRQ